MVEYEIPTFTLLRFEELRELGYGDLLDHALFFNAIKDPVKVARIVYQTAIFPTPAPTEEEFFDALDGDGVVEARRRIFKAYKDFFPTPIRLALELLFDPIKAEPTRPERRAATSGENEPSN